MPPHPLLRHFPSPPAPFLPTVEGGVYYSLCSYTFPPLHRLSSVPRHLWRFRRCAVFRRCLPPVF
eukprot:1755723-Pleurochrysis_carterae.AAC.1